MRILKSIMLIACIMLTSLSAIAGDLKVTNGKASFQKNEGTVAFVFNWAMLNGTTKCQ